MALAVEPADLRAFLNLAVAPLFLAAAWYFAVGRPRNAATWSMTAFLALLGMRSIAGGLVDVFGASTSEGSTWSAAFFDINLVTFTLFLWFAALFPGPRLKLRSALGATWYTLVATQTALDVVWLAGRTILPPSGLVVSELTVIVTLLVPASILLIAWRARDLAPPERRGAVLVVVSGAISVYNAQGGALVGMLLGGRAGDLFELPLALVTAAFFGFRWRIWFPTLLLAFGATQVLVRDITQVDYSSFALVLMVRAIVPVHVAQRTNLFELGRPPRWLTRLVAFIALASGFVMVNVILVVVSGGQPLAVAIGVFLGLVVGVTAALAVLPRGARSLFPFGGQRADPVALAADTGLVLGRYRFVRHLGEGGQGRAQVHVDEKLQREVVLKRVGAGEGAPAMREARALARVPNEHVVRVYDTDVHHGEGLIVMEHVAGGSLAGWLARSADGKLPLVEALRITDEMLSALAACHDAGVVHGDVKPANVLVTPEGRVKLADFGSARAAANVTLMPGGGTLRYMAPEQLRGQAADARTDLYATAIVLHEMLSGQWHLGETPMEPAFTTVRTLQGDLALTLPPNAEHLRRVLEKALAREPADRYQTAREMADALRLTSQ